MSDVTSCIDRDQFATMMTELVRVARPGARICYRNFLSRHRPDATFDSVLRRDDELCDRLYHDDYAFVYQFEVFTVGASGAAVRETDIAMRRSVDWVDGAVCVVDQRALPQQYRITRLNSVDEVVEAISTLTVRGAPAIGAAGALAVALSALRHGDDLAAVRADADRIAAARPTAVNLAW